MADLALVAKGRSEPRLGLVQQLAVSLALARQHAAALAPWGWTPAETAELARAHDRLSSELAEQAESKDAKKRAFEAQAAAMAEAKALKRKLDRAVRSVFRTEQDLPVTPDAFHAGGTIDRSVPKMVAWLTTSRPAVVALAAHLAKRFGGADPVAALDEARTALTAADTRQEREVQDLPRDTLEVYEAKGRAMLLITQLNDAGRNAFDEDAHEAAKFNKDLVLRARKSREPKVPTSA